MLKIFHHMHCVEVDESCRNTAASRFVYFTVRPSDVMQHQGHFFDNAGCHTLLHPPLPCSILGYVACLVC